MNDPLVRAEAIDIEQASQLIGYLRRAGRIGPQEQPSVSVLDGGVSNRTVLLERPDGEAWVLKQALAKLRVEVDWFSDPQRVQREAAALRCLPALLPPDTVPRLVFEDRTLNLLAMTAVAKPNSNWKSLLLSGALSAAHIDQFGSILGSLHSNAERDRDTLAAEFADRSYFESLRLEPYYLYTATQLPIASAFIERVVRENRQAGQTLVHGDYSPKNVLVRNDRLVLLDHEVMHWGDPAFDLGFALTHLLSKAHHLSLQRAAFATAAVNFWGAYRRQLGSHPDLAALEQRAVRNTLACLLARVAGRSPLEYLDDREQRRQQEVVVGLIARPPSSIGSLATRFVEDLEAADR